jgi:hypothetical protein
MALLLYLLRDPVYANVTMPATGQVRSGIIVPIHQLAFTPLAYSIGNCRPRMSWTMCRWLARCSASPRPRSWATTTSSTSTLRRRRPKAATTLAVLCVPARYAQACDSSELRFGMSSNVCCITEGASRAGLLSSMQGFSQVTTLSYCEMCGC